MTILATHKSDSLSKQYAFQSLVGKLDTNDKIINSTIDDYINNSLDYNQYTSIFPHFFYAKKNGFIKAKYFTIKYGVKNEDPLTKSKSFLNGRRALIFCELAVTQRPLSEDSVSRSFYWESD
jgi:hypothetical protein